ncbi:hypothetical protein FHG87_007322 [Trinorchestia longiramus]|nr:hypothetical protein FHG87_007322 [Trinorchestia longiramus]
MISSLASHIDSVAGVRDELNSVHYSSRFCLGLFYPPAARDKITLPGGVAVMYLNDPSSPFCYVSIDGDRRSLDRGAEDSIGVMVHTTRGFGEARVEETKEALLEELLEHFRELMPHWPQPENAFCHKWRYSQVVTAVPPQREGSVRLCEGSLVLSGDAFTHSNMDGCIAAATSATQALLDFAAQLE